MYYITFFRTNQCVFTHKKVAIHLGPATFKIFTSHQQPGRHRTSDNRIRPPPRESDDPVPAYGIPPDGVSYVLPWQPLSQSLREAPAS